MIEFLKLNIFSSHFDSRAAFESKPRYILQIESKIHSLYKCKGKGCSRQIFSRAYDHEESLELKSMRYENAGGANFEHKYLARFVGNWVYASDYWGSRS